VWTVSDKAAADLGWPTIATAWTARCATARGSAAVARAMWLEDVAAARARVDEISEARRLIHDGAALPLGGVAEIDAAIARVRKAGMLDAPELIAVAATGRALTRLRAHLRERAEVVPRLAARGAPMVDLGHVYLPIEGAFDDSGRLVDHASDALGPLRRALAAIKQGLERRMEAMLQDEQFAPYLQDSYFTQREERYVLPIRTDGKGFVRGIVHGTSQSGQTLFIEPEEIVELNNKLKLAECDVADEERRIMVQFSGWIAEEADGYDASLAAAEGIDLVAAAAALAEDLVATAPIIDEGPRLALLHARHPLMLLAGRRCVANDLALEAGTTMIVSGPNAGGKTVALKAVGLAALMVRAGLHVAAESGSVVGWFTDVRTDVGDAQSLEKDLSTFTGHIVNLGEVLAAARPGLLWLVDEIAVGTEPEQGAALAQAVLEAMAARGVTAIVTTHYERLKVLAAADPRFTNASVGFDFVRMAPTFKLHAGAPGSSGALAVARRTGLDGAIVARAQELLGSAGVRVDDLLVQLAEQRRRLEEERGAVLAELEVLEGDRAAARLATERTTARLEKEARAAHAEAMAALKGARRELEGLRAEVRRRAHAAALELGEPATMDDVREQGRRIAVVSATVAKHEPARNLPPGRAPRDGELVPGTPVIVPSLGGRAVVAAAPTKGKVDVRLGAMHATVDVAEVLIDRHKAAERAARPEPKEAKAAAPAPAGPEVVLQDGQGDARSMARTVDTTVDVRGSRADEAVAAVDRFIDEGMMMAREQLFVVHGHGTGALRQAVRAHLAKHPAIRSWRAGEKSEGGDGITVMFLRD
jgi:DNA mismatch repair protein MutS2